LWWVKQSMCKYLFMFKQQLNINIFMIIPLINMNTSLRKYPLEGRLTASPSPTFWYYSLWVTSIGVAVLSRCRQMIAVKTRYRRSSHSFVVDVEEVVVRERAVAWRRSPKNLIVRLSRAGSSAAGRGSGGSALATTVRAVQAMRMWKESSKQRERRRGLLNKNTLCK
jgi:hypothetical protein